MTETTCDAKNYYVADWLALSTQLGFAQLCGGNLGDNIFTDGDFGRGTDNLIRVDPTIAPGYTYTTSVPPQDGEYVITNNTGAWSGLFGTWLPIRDNSSRS